MLVFADVTRFKEIFLVYKIEWIPLHTNKCQRSLTGLDSRTKYKPTKSSELKYTYKVSVSELICLKNPQYSMYRNSVVLQTKGSFMKEDILLYIKTQPTRKNVVLKGSKEIEEYLF